MPLELVIDTHTIIISITFWDNFTYTYSYTYSYTNNVKLIIIFIGLTDGKWALILLNVK